MGEGTHAIATNGGAAAQNQAVSVQDSQPPKKVHAKRLYFIDWLRTFLTVLVLVHHTWSTYVPNGGDTYWFVQKQARDDWILVTLMGWLTSAPSMPYAMCLFFLLAGYFSPGSVNRKGALRHVWDRVIRLLIPVIVYAVVINPLIYTVNKAAGIPADNPSELAVVRDMSYAETWAFCLKRFNIAPGPTWFIWCLFWFDIGYVLLRLLHSAALNTRTRLAARKAAAAAAATTSVDSPVTTTLEAGDNQSSKHVVVEVGGSTVAPPPSSSSKSPSVVRQPAELQQYSVSTVLVGMALLSLAFAVVSFGALMATYDSDKVGGFDGFWIPGSFVIFRPSWMGPNAISFILGCQAMRMNLLRKLPSSITWWCLIAAAIWWPIGNLMPGYIDKGFRPEVLWGTYPISGAMVGYILYTKFAEWTFAVVWGVGMLLLFREHFNDAPGKLGRQLISGAYGAYIIHPLMIALCAWPFMHVPFVTFAGNAIAVSPLVVVSSWAVTALVRCIPGTQRVLG